MFVVDMFHPFDIFTIEGTLNRDMAHAGRRRRAMPMFSSAGAGDDIASADLFFRVAFALRPAATGNHNQILFERMRMPCGTRPGFECHQPARNPARLHRRE